MLGAAVGTGPSDGAGELRAETRDPRAEEKGG